MAIRASTPGTPTPPSPASDRLTAHHLDLVPDPAESRAERWASWVVIYLAALLSSLALGASAWALGLTG